LNDANNVQLTSKIINELAGGCDNSDVDEVWALPYPNYDQNVVVGFVKSSIGGGGPPVYRRLKSTSHRQKLSYIWLKL
jgi:hypothetical protein